MSYFPKKKHVQLVVVIPSPTNDTDTKKLVSNTTNLKVNVSNIKKI